MVAAAVVGSAVVGGVVSSNAAKKGAKAQTNAANQANETERYIYDQTREDQLPWQQAGGAGLNALMGLYGFEQVPVTPVTGTPAQGAGTSGAINTGNPLVDKFGNNPLIQLLSGNKNQVKTTTSTEPPEMKWQMAANPSAVSNQFMVRDPGYQFRLNEGQRNLENSAAARGGMMSGNFLKATTKFGQEYGANEFANIANRYGQLSGVGQTTNQNLAESGQKFASNFGQNVRAAGAARASGYAGQANAINGMIGNGLNAYGAYKGGFFG